MLFRLSPTCIDSGISAFDCFAVKKNFLSKAIQTENGEIREVPLF